MRRRPHLRFLSGTATSLALLLTCAPLHAQVVRQVTDDKTGESGTPALDDAGTSVYANTSTDQFGTNPRYSWQIAEWDAVTGAGSLLTDLADGVAWKPLTRPYSAGTASWVGPSVSVSDDGQTLAFISPSDPVGRNHDGSLEAFVMQRDGTGIVQLTDEPAPNAGDVIAIAMAGSANRVAFVANTDPLGANPDHRPQLFVVDTDGTGLVQLTSVTADVPLDYFSVDISDDGQRVVFSERDDWGSGAPELFAVNADGTNLRQLSLGGRPRISGNGEKVCFQSASLWPNYHVYSIDWDGTGLQRLSPNGADAFSPSITDDGQFVVYDDTFADPVQNPDGNREIWKVPSSGGAPTALTQTSDPIGNTDPVISGSGNRIAFLTAGGEFPGGDNADGGPELMAMDGSGGGVLQLTANSGPGYGYGAQITPDGSRIVFTDWDLYRIQADGTDLFRLTHLVEWPAEEPSVSGDGDTIVFTSAADPLGQNPGNNQVFAIEADGTGLRQLSPGTDGAGSDKPDIAANGSYVVFQSRSDITGENPEGENELFRMRPDGTDVLQITNDNDGIHKWPRVDENGVWVVFQSATDVDAGNPDGSIEVLRVKTDGTGLQRITADPEYNSWEPDLSGSGDRIVYSSSADPLGTNADHNYDIFLHEVSSATTQQLTFTTEGRNHQPRISKDGAIVYFRSDAPIFEESPIEIDEVYRVTVATGVVERVGSLRRAPSDMGYASWRYRSNQIAPDGTGERAAFGAVGDWAGRNPDVDAEVYLVDYSTPARIVVGKPSPTVVSWDPEPQPLRYDVVRGDVASLGTAGSDVDLGPVVCLEDDSPDTHTAGFEDSEDPAVGQAFFFLYRGSQGLNDGPGSYGQGTGDKERVAASGDCEP